VVLAAGDGAVQELRRVEDSRQPRAPGRTAVDELVVQRPEVGELDEGSDRRAAFVNGTQLEALDLGRFRVERRPGELLRDAERRATRPRLELLVPEVVPRPEGEDDVGAGRVRRERRAGPSQVDQGLLLVQRALLGGKVEAGEDDDVVEAVRPPFPRTALEREGSAPVGPRPRLDRVEDVRETNGLAAADDVDADSLELGDRTHQLGRERSELPGHQAALLKPSLAETSAAAATHSPPASGSRDSVSL
jgi:hypothetical protein